MTIKYRTQGSIVDDDADILVNTVNCVGVMGKGVALAFKKKWPGIMPAYRQACQECEILPGSCRFFPLPNHTQQWAAFATKDHWSGRSQLDWINTGLKRLAWQALAIKARSIAIPPPGCGNGGLDWRIVEPMVLEALSGFDLRIYAATTLGGGNG